MQVVSPVYFVVRSLALSSQHPAISKGERSESFASRCFKLIDRDKKGYITASDVERLGQEVELKDTKGDEIQEQNKLKVSNVEASEMIETTNRMFAQDAMRRERLEPSVFSKLFEPSFQ